MLRAAPLVSRPFDLSRAAYGQNAEVGRGESVLWRIRSQRSALRSRTAVRDEDAACLWSRILLPMGGRFFRKEDRKDLQTTRPKCARTTEQIKSPHSPETFAVAICEPRPRAAEVFFPREEGWGVIRPDITDVFKDKKAFRGTRKASEGRKHGVWENVAVDPWIGVEARKVSANSLAEE
jgi:hypothetical protein